MSISSLDWEDLRAFRAVFDAGSLLGAARRLRVTQPTVRRRLDALEQALGVALFTRTTSGVTPTETAHELAAHAAAMKRAADAFARTASAAPGAIGGTVRISASEVIGVEVLPPILTGLRTAHPRLAIELCLSNSLDDLSRQEADIAVRMVVPTQAALVLKRIGAIPLGIFAHRDLVARHGQPTTMEDLSRFPLIGPDRDVHYLDMLPGFGGHPRAFALRTDNQIAHLAAIRAGFGAGICQVALGRRSADLVQLLPDHALPALDTYIVMHEDLRRTARVRAAFDHLVGGLGDYVRVRPAGMKRLSNIP